MKKIALFLLVLSTLCSCRTRATRPTSFTEEAVLLEKGRVFQREWKDADFQDYKKVYILPVDTSYLKSLGWWDKQNVANYDDSDVWPKMQENRNKSAAKQFSVYMNKVFRKEFAESAKNRLEFVSGDKVDRETLVVKIALTEMVPVKKFLLGLNWIGDGSLKGGVATIEGKVQNAVTGKTLMSFTDRQVNSSTRVSDESGQLYWYSHAKPIIHDWAKMLVAACNETYLKKEE